MVSSSASVRGQFVGRVLANLPLCREHYRLTIAIAGFPPSAPGQFVQLACRNAELGNLPADEPVRAWELDRPMHADQPELRAPVALLRRPFSLAGRRDVAGGAEIEIIHRVVGLGTGWLSGLAEGDALSVIGPLGNRFTLPMAGQSAVLIGGGVGIPPMVYLAERLAGKKAAAFCGALTGDLLPLTLLGRPNDPDAVEPALVIDEFARHGIPSVISTDDGSVGFRGYVTQALERFLDSSALPQPILYACGPEPMLRRLAQIAGDRGIPCQIAVERAMACGMGTCQSCVIRVRRPAEITAAGAASELPEGGGADWVYRLACTDGPVFTAGELVW